MGYFDSERRVSALLASLLAVGCSDQGFQTDERPATKSQPLAPSSLHEIRPTGDPNGPANFGWAVASDGRRVLVGANRVAGAVGSEGAAYVFERQAGTGWAQVARLVSGEAPQAAQFGYSVALRGPIALVGAPYFDRGGQPNPGAAFVFERNAAGAWPRVARLDVPVTPNSYAGYAVALDNERAFVGAWGTNRVFVFERAASGAWSQSDVITSPQTAIGDRFGASLAFDVGQLLVGAPHSMAEAGAVYAFEQGPNGGWVQTQRLAGAAPGERFGRALAISGASAVVGYQGGARRAARGSDGSWSVQGNLPAPPVGFDFGNAVATLDGSTLVGAYLEDDAPKRDNGATYLYSSGPTGLFADRFRAPVPGSTDYFGYAVALGGSLGVVGAYGDDDFAPNGGAAYVVNLPQATACAPGSKCEPRRNQLACGVYRLSASQTVTDEGDQVEVGWIKLGRTAELSVAPALKLTSPPAGSLGILYLHETERDKDVRCRYSPPNATAVTWGLDGCKMPRAGNARVFGPNATIRADEIRFRLGGGDTLERGTQVSGDIELTETGACNAFAMDDCVTARSTATRFSANAERYENARFDAAKPFAVPASVPVLTPTLVAAGQAAELVFWSGTTRLASCTYAASAAGASTLAFGGCLEPGVALGTVLTSTRVALRLLPNGFNKGPLMARVELTPPAAQCVSPSADDDGDGVPTLVELAASRQLGVADVDRDGQPNWRDSDANGNGVADGVEVVDANASGVSDFVEVPCEPATYYADSDGDGFGDPATSVSACPPPLGYVDNGSDCNDAQAEVNPDALEVCADLVDNDCDALVEENCSPPDCTAAPVQGEGSLLSQFQAGHGFTANAGGTHNLNDAVDYVLGSQSAWIETNGLGLAKTLKKNGLGTFDFTDKMPRLWVKLDQVTSASTLQLYLGNNNLADQYKFSFESTQGQKWATEGDWVAFSMSWSDKHVSKVGNPNRAAITDVQLRAIDTNTGSPIKLHANQISMVDEPAAYPSGVMSVTFDDGFESQYSLAQPILDSFGFPATAYVIVSLVDAPGYATLSNLQDLQNLSGWEIGYHSYEADVHSAGFPSTPTADLEQDIDLGRDWLWSNGFTGHCDCAYPHGAFTGGATDVLGTVASRLSACRTVHQKHREAYPPSNAYKLRVLLVNKPVLVSTVTAAIDQAVANQEWIILVFHNLTETPLINNDYDPDDFEAIISHASSVGIPVKTVGEVLGL